MLAHEIRGSGEPLVLLHGMNHRRQAWYPVLEHLTEHRQVVLFDLPGHGESPDLDVRDGDPQQSLRDELVGAMSALGLERPHMAGNSFGGRIALEAAADGLVSSATALSPAAFWRNSVDFAYIRAAFHVMVIGARVLGPVLPLLARSAAARRVLGALIWAHPERIAVETFVADVRGMRRSVPMLHAFAPIAAPFEEHIPDGVPVTIAWGARDLILWQYQARIAARHLPGADHVTLPGCGHVPMSDDPALIAEVLLSGSATPPKVSS